MSHTTSEMKIMRKLFTADITVEFLQINYSFTIFDDIYNSFITSKTIYKTIQVPKPDPLWAFN